MRSEQNVRCNRDSRQQLLAYSLDVFRLVCKSPFQWSFAILQVLFYRSRLLVNKMFGFLNYWSVILESFNIQLRSRLRRCFRGVVRFPRSSDFFLPCKEACVWQIHESICYKFFGALPLKLSKRVYLSVMPSTCQSEVSSICMKRYVSGKESRTRTDVCTSCERSTAAPKSPSTQDFSCFACEPFTFSGDCAWLPSTRKFVQHVPSVF